MLSEYDFEIVHRAGKYQTHVDALSRMRVALIQDRSDIEPLPIRYIIKREERKDEKLKPIHSLSKGEKREPYFLDDDGLLFKKEPTKLPYRNKFFELLMVPETHQRHILQAYHDAPYAGHYGSRKTWKKMKRAVYWDTMRKDIEEYCKSCPSCQRRKGHN